MRKMLINIMILGVALNLSGCLLLAAGVVGGAGTAVWLGGKLSQEVDSPFDKTVAASKKALQSFKLDIEKETKKEGVAQLISRYSDGRKVWIDVRGTSDTRSKIEVRVGATGDKGASREILDRIHHYL